MSSEKKSYSRIQNYISDPWSIQIQIAHLQPLSNLINCVYSTPILLNNNNKGHRIFYSISNKSVLSGGASGYNAIYATQFESTVDKSVSHAESSIVQRDWNLMLLSFSKMSNPTEKTFYLRKESCQAPDQRTFFTTKDYF